jgi:hypothetical protein
MRIVPTASAGIGDADALILGGGVGCAATL